MYKVMRFVNKGYMDYIGIQKVVMKFDGGLGAAINSPDCGLYTTLTINSTYYRYNVHVHATMQVC